MIILESDVGGFVCRRRLEQTVRKNALYGKVMGVDRKRGVCLVYFFSGEMGFLLQVFFADLEDPVRNRTKIARLEKEFRTADRRKMQH